MFLSLSLISSLSSIFMPHTEISFVIFLSVLFLSLPNISFEIHWVVIIYHSTTSVFRFVIVVRAGYSEKWSFGKKITVLSLHNYALIILFSGKRKLNVSGCKKEEFIFYCSETLSSNKNLGEIQFYFCFQENLTREFV